MVHLSERLTLTLSDVGHLDFLQQVSKHGDYIIVGVHSDPVSFDRLSDFVILCELNPKQPDNYYRGNRFMNTKRWSLANL